MIGLELRWPQAKDVKQCQHPPEAGKGREGFPSRACRGSVALTDLSLGLLDSSTVKRIHFCCFKPPYLWQFVMAAQRNQHTMNMCVCVCVFPHKHTVIIHSIYLLLCKNGSPNLSNLMPWQWFIISTWFCESGRAQQGCSFYSLCWAEVSQAAFSLAVKGLLHQLGWLGEMGLLASLALYMDSPHGSLSFLATWWLSCKKRFQIVRADMQVLIKPPLALHFH